MEQLDADTVLRVGGWDPRFTRVLFVRERGDLGLALVDADSDLNLDVFVRDDEGRWRGDMSGSSNGYGPGLSGDAVFDFGEAAAGTVATVDHRGVAHEVVTESDGWWVFLARRSGDEADDDDAVARRPVGGSPGTVPS